MRWICISLAFAFMTFSVFAQDQQKDAATPSSRSVLVNGQPSIGKVLEIGGKHFIAVEDLAQSLRGTISYSDAQVALTFALPSATGPAQPPAPQPTARTSPRASQPSVKAPQLPPSPSPANAATPSGSQLPVAAAQSAETGSVKGTLTYFFNFHDGSKPDTGTKIWLVKDHVEIPADQNFVGSSTALGTSVNPEQYTAVKFAIPDGNGNFELLEVSPGQYTLILQSAHTKGTLKDKRNLFGRANRSNPRDSVGRVESLNVPIKAGETVDVAKDFGPNVE
jgi:hypothetical protein